MSEKKQNRESHPNATQRGILTVIGMLIGFAISERIKDDAAAELIECPRCGARPGLSCYRPSGVRLTHPHRARVRELDFSNRAIAAVARTR